MSPSGLAEPLRVVCAVQGEAYVSHCATMLHSLLSAHPAGSVRVEYLHAADTSARGRRSLAEMVARMNGEIHYHDVPPIWTSGLPVRGFTRRATWYRMFLDRLLPDAARAIYLDLDILVLDSLIPLWQTPLQGHLLGAVTNVPFGADRHRERPELEGDPYFNAGVMLLDLAEMRRESTGERLRRFALTHGSRLALRDQDALNEVLHDRCLHLHPRWNCMNAIKNLDYAADYFTEQELAEARRAPAIRHFEGPAFNKPWHLLADRDSQRLYLEHRRQTPWPRLRRTGLTPLNLVRYTRRRLVV